MMCLSERVCVYECVYECVCVCIRIELHVPCVCVNTRVCVRTCVSVNAGAIQAQFLWVFNFLFSERRN